jgi:hypothetical protein
VTGKVMSSERYKMTPDELKAKVDELRSCIVEKLAELEEERSRCS